MTKTNIGNQQNLIFIQILKSKLNIILLMGQRHTKFEIKNDNDILTKCQFLKRCNQLSYGEVDIYHVEVPCKVEHYQILVKNIQFNEVSEAKSCLQQLQQKKTSGSPYLTHIYQLQLIEDSNLFNTQYIIASANEYITNNLSTQIQYRINKNQRYHDKDIIQLIYQVTQGLIQHSQNGFIHMGISSYTIFCDKNDYKIFSHYDNDKDSNYRRIVDGTFAKGKYYLCPKSYNAYIKGSECNVDNVKSSVFSLALCALNCCYKKGKLQIYYNNEINREKLLEVLMGLRGFFSKELIELLAQMLEISECYRMDYQQILQYVQGMKGFDNRFILQNEKYALAKLEEESKQKSNKQQKIEQFNKKQIFGDCKTDRIQNDSYINYGQLVNQRTKSPLQYNNQTKMATKKQLLQANLSGRQDIQSIINNVQINDRDKSKEINYKRILQKDCPDVYQNDKSNNKYDKNIINEINRGNKYFISPNKIEQNPLNLNKAPQNNRTPLHKSPKLLQKSIKIKQYQNNVSPSPTLKNFKTYRSPLKYAQPTKKMDRTFDHNMKEYLNATNNVCQSNQVSTQEQEQAQTVNSQSVKNQSISPIKTVRFEEQLQTEQKEPKRESFIYETNIQYKKSKVKLTSKEKPEISYKISLNE